MTRDEMPQIHDWKCYSLGCRLGSPGPHGNQKLSQALTKLALAANSEAAGPSLSQVLCAIHTSCLILCQSPTHLQLTPAADGKHPQQEAMGKTSSGWLLTPQHALKLVSCAGSLSQRALPSLPFYFNCLT